MKTKCPFCNFETNTTTWKTYYEHKAHLKNCHENQYTALLIIEAEIAVLKHQAQEKFGMAAYGI